MGDRLRVEAVLDELRGAGAVGELVRVLCALLDVLREERWLPDVGSPSADLQEVEGLPLAEAVRLLDIKLTALLVVLPEGHAEGCAFLLEARTVLQEKAAAEGGDEAGSATNAADPLLVFDELAVIGKKPERALVRLEATLTALLVHVRDAPRRFEFQAVGDRATGEVTIVGGDVRLVLPAVDALHLLHKILGGIREAGLGGGALPEAP